MLLTNPLLVTQKTINMKLHIHLQENMTTGDIKTQFSSSFPNLKLEIFNEEPQMGEKKFFQRPVKDTAYLREISKYLHDGFFSFQPTQTVAAFERCLQLHFGLAVQVYRKTGN